MKINGFQPKLFSCLKDGYNKTSFVQDLLAGVIVGIVALPLAIAFGIASGATPEAGILTAIVAGFIIALFGGSKVQIGGPTGAFIVIVYGIIQDYGMNGLWVATFMAGAFLILMGILHLGTIIKYIPYPIIVGFTSGIALTIFATQIKDLLGLQIENVPAGFLDKWVVYFQNMNTISWWSLLVGVASILLIVFTPKISRRIPGSLVAIVVMTLVCLLLKSLGVQGIETIGDRFSISSQLPQAEVPRLTWDSIRHLASPALVIAMLGAIESLLSAAVADGVIGDRHDSNQELIAQGIANMVTPLIGGIPATGAIARTMTNINNGGRTPVAGIIHAVVLALIYLFLMPLVKFVPMACLAGILVVVSYNMSEWRSFKAILKNPKSDITVLLVTFFLTVIFDLTVAIEVGVLIACLLCMRRMAETTNVSVLSDEIDPNADSDVQGNLDHLTIPEGVKVYEINGPYFFGIGNKFEEMMGDMGGRAKVRIIRMRKVPFIDSTGVHNLGNMCRMCRQMGVKVVLSGVNENVMRVLVNAGVDEIVGKENICSHINLALERAAKIVAE
ncbi:MAG: sulfate permease [Bacteroidaceae bacterium]|nr:sulfate permease [Candidatus Colenecus caballi]MCQ2072975.1 sulfate permease [Bacteroidaceae bacterium]